MTDFERDIRKALRRRDPPRDLTAGVMAKIAASRGPRTWWFPPQVRRPVLAAALGLLVIGSGLHRYREYQAGLRAKEQLMFALEITAQKLSIAQGKVAELSRRRIGHGE